MRTGWRRWTSCLAPRPSPWLGPRAAINRSAPIITGGRQRRSSPSGVGACRCAARACGRRSAGKRRCPRWRRFRDRDPLTARMMQQLLAGVSTRHYEGSLEARPSGRPTRGSSKSAVSRAVVRRTRQRLHEYLARRLDGLEVLALFMDGVVVAQQTVIVVLGITRDGGKVPLGLRLGSTENAVVCTELLQDLLARGLTLAGRGLWVIDGGKGLRKALGDVFGDAAVIQRCQLHKARNP